MIIRENLYAIINQLLSNLWLFVLFGLIYILILEKESVLAFIKNKKIKLLYPLLKRAVYPLVGGALILYSFVIVSSILNLLTPESLPQIDHSNVVPGGFWATFKYQTQFTGIFSVIGLILAGISLILSAGGKWLVNLSKSFITLTVLYLFASVLVGYA